MNKCTQLSAFMRDLFDGRATARKGAEIVAGILQARSPPLSEIAREMDGKEAANYKRIQRFLAGTAPDKI
jgi:hypothetical protein